MRRKLRRAHRLAALPVGRVATGGGVILAPGSREDEPEYQVVRS
jgi:hypothetical protein